MELKELLGEELYDQVMAKLAEDKNNKNIELLVNDKKENTYIPKSRFDTVIQQKKALGDKVDELEIQIEEISNSSEDVEAIKTQLAEAQTKLSDAKTEVQNIKKDAEIKLAIASSGAKKSDLIAKLLDASKVTLKEDGTVEGLKEQLESIKQDVPELFNVISPAGGKPGTPSGGSQGGSEGAGEDDSNGNNGGEGGTPAGGTGNPGKGGKGSKGKVETIGERLAKRRVASHSPEVDFFK